MSRYSGQFDQLTTFSESDMSWAAAALAGPPAAPVASPPARQAVATRAAPLILAAARTRRRETLDCIIPAI
jgi:hypothetical protein